MRACVLGELNASGSHGLIGVNVAIQAGGGFAAGVDDQGIAGAHHGVEIPRRIFPVLQHGRGVRRVSGETAAFLQLKVGEVNGAGTVGYERPNGDADHTHILTGFDAFAEADEIIYFHKRHLPVQRPLNFADMANPAGGNRTGLQHNIRKIHLTGAVGDTEPDGDRTQLTVTFGRSVSCDMLKICQISSPSSQNKSMNRVSVVPSSYSNTTSMPTCPPDPFFKSSEPICAEMV